VSFNFAKLALLTCTLETSLTDKTSLRFSINNFDRKSSKLKNGSEIVIMVQSCASQSPVYAQLNERKLKNAVLHTLLKLFGYKRRFPSAHRSKAIKEAWRERLFAPLIEKGCNNKWIETSLVFTTQSFFTSSCVVRWPCCWPR